MSFQFYDYQEQGITEVATLASKGVRRIVFQAPTGSGKTVLFSGLTKRFSIKYTGHRVLIAVHRTELLEQTVRTLKKVAGIEAGMMIADYKTPVRLVNGFYVPYNSAQVIVCMVETLHNRFKKYESYLGDIGMLIVDECHIANFNKIYDHFKRSLTVGFSATPVSSNKRIPLRLFFDDIVSPVTIKELVETRRLAKNITFTVKGAINRNKLSMKGNDFDEGKMALTYSAPKHIENCVKQYAKYCMGMKTIVFNCNIEHSKKVAEAFTDHGYNCRHMDSNAKDEDRKAILEWFANTDDAILCNVALYTTGFDEPTVKAVIVNRATASLPLWLQMCGRGSRFIDGIKEEFIIIDLGANQPVHGDWHYPHDWKDKFYHPEKVGPKKGGGPTKLCVNKECEAMIHLSTKICPFCGTLNAKEVEYDKVAVELELLTKGIEHILDKLIEQNQKYEPYKTLHQVKNNLVQRFKAKYGQNMCSQEVRDILNVRYQEYVKDWCNKNEKEYDKWHKTTTRQWLMAEMDRYYGKIEQPENEPA